VQFSCVLSLRLLVANNVCQMFHCIPTDKRLRQNQVTKCVRRRGVPRLDGVRETNKFGAPMFVFKSFRKQMCCIEESTFDIVGTFRRNPPQWFDAWGIVPLRNPLVTPLVRRLVFWWERTFRQFCSGVYLHPTELCSLFSNVGCFLEITYFTNY